MLKFYFDLKVHFFFFQFQKKLKHFHGPLGTEPTMANEEGFPACMSSHPHIFVTYIIYSLKGLF